MPNAGQGMPRGPSNLQNVSGANRGQRLYDPNMGCWFCEESTHRDTFNSMCPHKARMIEEGKIHLNENGRMCVGHPKPGAVEVRFFPRISKKENVERAIAAYSHPKPQTEVSNVRVGISTQKKYPVMRRRTRRILSFSGSRH